MADIFLGVQMLIFAEITELDHAYHSSMKLEFEFRRDHNH